MRIGFFQFYPIFGDIQTNVDHVLKSLSRVSADLIVLPEFFNTGYQFVSKKEVKELSEPIPNGYTSKRLSQWARENGIFLVAGLAEQEGEQFYNSAILVGPQGVFSVYRKIHLFNEETLWFSPGNKNFEIVEVKGTRVGIIICFDWIFPEAVRTLAIKGADLICHPSNLVLPYCPNAMVTRAIENRVFTITANRIGSEERNGKEKLTFIGQSEIVSPEGQILHRASENQEEFHEVQINPLEARKKQINPYNHLLNDRKPERYTS